MACSSRYQKWPVFRRGLPQWLVGKKRAVQSVPWDWVMKLGSQFSPRSSLSWSVWQHLCEKFIPRATFNWLVPWTKQRYGPWLNCSSEKNRLFAKTIFVVMHAGLFKVRLKTCGKKTVLQGGGGAWLMWKPYALPHREGGVQIQRLIQLECELSAWCFVYLQIERKLYNNNKVELPRWSFTAMRTVDSISDGAVKNPLWDVVRYGAYPYLRKRARFILFG